MRVPQFIALRWNEDFPSSLFDVAGQFLGQPLFALGLTCVYFVPGESLSLKGGPITDIKFLKLISKIRFEGHNWNPQKKSMQV